MLLIEFISAMKPEEVQQIVANLEKQQANVAILQRIDP